MDGDIFMSPRSIKLISLSIDSLLIKYFKEFIDRWMNEWTIKKIKMNEFIKNGALLSWMNNRNDQTMKDIKNMHNVVDGWMNKWIKNWMNEKYSCYVNK